MTLSDFIHHLTWADIPETARHMAKLCLMDTLGAGLGGRQTELSRIIHDFAAATFGGQGARLWQDGREVSPAGAALANGMTVDALDIHDGYKPTKGHAGAALIPALLATLALENAPISGQELLTTLAMAYEVALRAGIALHTTVCDYHTSGAWNALGCAALTARRLTLNAEQTRHALGIAEYHGPRSQMMRVIDHPTMLKDGSGWGALAGVSAALLAARGFTGAPAITVEAAEVEHLWNDLGTHWRLTGQYFKPYAVCYWAQAPIAGALKLQQEHGLRPESIQRVRVVTFYEAVCLDGMRPTTTEEAQYSLPFPLASALTTGQLGPAQLTGEALNNPAILKLAERVTLVEEPAYTARFPAERVARVYIETTAGETFDSGEITPRWDSARPATDAELRDKFRWLAETTLPPTRAAELGELLWHCDELAEVGPLAALLAQAP